MKTVILLSLCIALGTLSARALAANPPSGSASAKLESQGGGQLLAGWIDVQLFAIRNAKIPSPQIRQSAYSAIALYEAVVAGDKHYRSLAGQLNGLGALPVPPGKRNICWEASASGAVAAMFRFFYIGNASTTQKIDSMEMACSLQLSKAGYSEASVKSGLEYGRAVAQAIIEWSKTDGFSKANDPYTIPAGDGLWEPTPPKYAPPIMPYAKNARCMVAGSIGNALPPAPVAFSADKLSAFYKMAEEVYQTSKNLDESKKTIASFWDDDPAEKKLNPGGHWAFITRTLILDKKLSLIESARLYAELFITMNDAVIGCFTAKYTYNLERPVTYIRKYMNDTTWNPLIVTPAHPEYPAAHATISRSAATVLTKLFGNNDAFVDHTYEYLGFGPRFFKNYTAMSEEIGMSRLYGGIHYVPSIKAGFTQGEIIGNNILNMLVFRK